MGTIYLLTNAITGDKYVGSTEDLIERIRQHSRLAKAGRTGRIMDAIREYGIEAFSVDVLEDDVPTDDLKQKETEWMIKLGTLGHMNRFASVAGTGNHPHTPEGKLKMGEVNTKQWQVRHPNGHTEDISNLNEFCRDHGLTPSNMWKVANGKRPHHKGYRIASL